jgi:hypothetical protein
MKHWQLPSGLQRGLPLIVQRDWTPEQALAVIELLDDLRAVIYEHYQPQILELMREQRCMDLHGSGKNGKDPEPF